MIRALICLLLFATVASAQSQRTAAPTPDPAEPVHVKLAETQYEIRNLEDEVTVRLDLTMQPGVAAVEPKLADVALGKRHDQNLLSAFSVEMEKADDKKVIPTLLVKVRTRELEQGTYHLQIKIWPATAATPAQPAPSPPVGPRRPAPKHVPTQAVNPQTLKIEITLPAATLQAPGTLVVEQVRPFLFALGTPESPTLALTEGSGKKTRLTNVNVTQTHIPAGENKATNVRVEFGPIAEVIPAKTGNSAVTLTGDFPLGTTKGSALITAPQLASPVALGFEVRARRSRSTIVAVILFGLVAGFFTRVWAKQRIELHEARLKAIDAVKTLEREIARRRDGPFREQLSAPLERLNTAIEESPAKELNDSVAAANAALSEALANLDGRRTTARADLQALKELAGGRAKLPPAVAGAFAIDERLLGETARLIEGDDVAGAQAAMDDVVKRLGGEVGAAVSTWRVKEEEFLEQLSGLAAVLPSSTAEGLAGTVTSLKTKLGELPLTDEDARAEQIANLSDSLRETRVRADELLLKVTGRLGMSADTLRSQFEQVAAPAHEQILQAVGSLAELRQNLTGWADRPETGAQELHAALVNVKALWRDALLAQVVGPNANAVTETKNAVQALIDQDKYLDASLRVVQHLRDNPPADDQLLGEEEVGAAAAGMPQVGAGDSFIDLLGRVAAAGERRSTHTVHEKTIPPTLDELRVSTLRELVRDRATNFGFASIFILAIGYALFADKFVGTFSDLLAVFVWAYGLDISVEAVMETGKSLKK